MDSSPPPPPGIVLEMKKRPREEEEGEQQQPLAKSRRRFQDFPRLEVKIPNIPPCDPIETGQQMLLQFQKIGIWTTECIDNQEKTLVKLRIENGLLRGKIDTIKSWNPEEILKELENDKGQLQIRYLDLKADYASVKEQSNFNALLCIKMKETNEAAAATQTSRKKAATAAKAAKAAKAAAAANNNNTVATSSSSDNTTNLVAVLNTYLGNLKQFLELQEEKTKLEEELNEQLSLYVTPTP